MSKFAEILARKLNSVQTKEFKNIDLGEVAIILTGGEISREDVEKARKEYETKNTTA